MRRRRLVGLVVVLSACGGARPPQSPPETPGNQGAPPADGDAACPAAGTPFEPPDGAFRCRELPFVTQFPPGAAVTRQDEGTGWNGGVFFFAKASPNLKVGIIAGPQRVPMTSEQLERVLDGSLGAVAPGAVVTVLEPPVLAGATVSRAVSFTTPDGGAGIVHAHYGYSWLVAVMATSRNGEKPDQPMGKAFLASLQLRPLAEGRVELALVDGATIEIPTSSWEAHLSFDDSAVRTSRWYVLPGRGTVLGIRAFEPQDLCARVRLATDTDLGVILDSSLSFGETKATVFRHVERGAYSEAEGPGGSAVASRLVCIEPLAVQLIAFGDDIAASRALVEELGPTVQGPR